MLVKSICILFLVIQQIYEMVLNHIRDEYRKRPLPEEVSDIYDQKRYQDFLSYKSDYRSLVTKSKLFTLAVDIFVILSPFFAWMDNIGHNNPYLILLMTLVVLSLLDWASSYVVEYHATFFIEEKYGLNKKTKQDFNKDFWMDKLAETAMEIVLYVVLIFICSHISKWTNNFSITYIQSFIFAFGLLILFGLLALAFSFFSLFIMMKQYTFTDLEDEVLLNKIAQMRKGCKKKVRGIKVYDESKKSTTKNAFVLSVPFYRIIGIADNFLNENSQRELYGVLAHEIGHMKHKKDIFNYLKYIFLILLFLFVVWLIPNGGLVVQLVSVIDQSFDVQNAYYLYFMVLTILFSPLGFLGTLYLNYATRREEYEADQNAVKEGYGQDLIHLFKELSRDELVDVNPSPIIEFIEYDHPGMYRRILGLSHKK